MVTDDCAFVLGVDGFLTEEEMFTTLKVNIVVYFLSLPRVVFSAHVE